MRTGWSHLAEHARVAAPPTNQRVDEPLHACMPQPEAVIGIAMFQKVWKWREKCERSGGNLTKREPELRLGLPA
jgi:hypothetical protein